MTSGNPNRSFVYILLFHFFALVKNYFDLYPIL